MTTKDSALLSQIKTSADAYENDALDSEDGGGSDIDFATLFLVIRRSILWIILLIVLGVSGSYLYLRWTKPVYKSSSVLKIDERSESGMLGLGGKLGEAASSQQSAMSLQGEVELIKSNLIYNKLKDSLPLDVNYYAEGTVLESELFATTPFKVDYKILNESFFNTRFKLVFLDSQRFRLSYQIGEEIIANEYKVNQPIKDKNFEFTINKTISFGEGDIDRNFSFVVNSDAAIDGYLNQNLLVEIVNPNANTISISFTEHNPEKAQAIVNKINEAYLIQKKAVKELATAQTLAFLDNQLNQTQGDLAQAEKDVEAFVRENKTYDVKADVGNKLSKIEESQKEKLELQIEVALLNDFASAVSQGKKVDQVVPSFSKVQDPQLMANITKLGDLQLRKKIQSQSIRPGETAASTVLEAEIEFVKKNIRQLIQKNRELLQREISRIDQTLKTTESDLSQLPEKETEFARLQRRYELFEKYYLLLKDKQVEFGIAKAGTTPDFQILQPANRPTAPISPDKLIIYAIGLAAGIFLGVGLVASRYLMHNTVTNLRELERNLKAPVLGVVPTYNKEKLLVSKIIVDKNPKSAISESMRSIRTNLEFMSSSKKKRLISITSTISGEGKTFVAVNLGGIIALSEQKVIILDLDMRKPKVHLAFDADNAKGMSTILIEKHSVQECIQKTNIPTLDFISAGPTPPNPSELILNPKFDEMLDELHQFYDVIIVDTPPVGLVTDGILVMRKADVPIYIVRANFSKKAFLKDINKLIKNNNFTHFAAILNDANAIGPYGYSYGYGYGSSYGYGGGYYDDDRADTGFFSRLKNKFS